MYRRTTQVDADEEQTRRLAAERENERLRHQLQRARRLESLGLLAGGIAHDFNNHLHVISNYAEFAVRDLGDSRAVREDIAAIADAATRAGELAQQLLRFSRRQSSVPQPVDLNDLVAGTARLLARTLPERVSIELRLADDLKPVVADRVELDQVVMNLVMNARDAIAGSGTITLATDTVDLTEEDVPACAGVAGRHSRLRVIDSGEGMSREVMESAMDPFFTTKPEGEGTGLGLATVYGIVRRAGGHVQLSSELGSGTTVTVHLPAADDDRLPARQPH